MATPKAPTSTTNTQDPDPASPTPPAIPPPTLEDRIEELLISLQQSPRSTTHHLTLLTTLLSTPFSPNTTLYHGSPLLLLVTAHPHLVSALLQAGADPNLSHQTPPYRSISRTPLIRAIRQSHSLDSIKLLLEAGAMNPLVLYAALYMKAPKHGAGSVRVVEVMRLLLKYGAGRYVDVRQGLEWYDILEYDSVLQAVLFVVGERGWEMVEMLVQAGASVEVEAYGEGGVSLVEWARRELGEKSKVYGILKGAREERERGE